MEVSDIAKKLKVKENFRICVLGAPEGYDDLLTPLPAGVTSDKTLQGEYDLIHAFIVKKQQLADIVPTIKNHLKKGGIIWISYPKMTSKVETDLNRDILREAVEPYDTKTVSMISINDVWSAMRLKCL